MRNCVNGLSFELSRNQIDFCKKITLIIGPKQGDQITKSDFQKVVLFSGQPVKVTLPKKLYQIGESVANSELFLMLHFCVKDENCLLNILGSFKSDFSNLVCNSKLKWKHDILAFYSFTFDELRQSTKSLINNVFL